MEAYGLAASEEAHFKQLHEVLAVIPEVLEDVDISSQATAMDELLTLKEQQQVIAKALAELQENLPDENSHVAVLDWFDEQKRVGVLVRFLSNTAKLQNTKATQSRDDEGLPAKVLLASSKTLAALGVVVKGACEQRMDEGFTLLRPVAGGLADGKSWKAALTRTASMTETLAAGKVLLDGDVPSSLHACYKKCYEDCVGLSPVQIQRQADFSRLWFCVYLWDGSFLNSLGLILVRTFFLGASHSRPSLLQEDPAIID